MTRSAAIYARISVDRAGRKEGVKAQEKWGRAYAAAAWPELPVRVFTDNDLSAARDNVTRPGYEELREAIRNNEVAHVWAVEQSRLERREVQWFELAAELDAAGIEEIHTNRDGIVRVRDDVAGIKAVLNAGEVRKLKRRINDRLAEIAANGEPSGSRPFGYTHGVTADGIRTYVVVEEQAEAIRWAAEKVLAGWSLAHIATELRSRGMHGGHQVKVRDTAGNVVTDADGKPVPRPSRLTANSVRGMLTAPSIAGRRVHKGHVVGQGNWTAILDDDTFDDVTEKLRLPRVVRRSDGGTYPVSEAHVGNPAGRRYLLTGGLAVCGVCGAPMVGSMKQLKNSRRPYLLCHPNRGGKGCVGIMLAETEQYVVDDFHARLDDPKFLDQVAADAHTGRRGEVTEALRWVERQRTELAELWAQPGVLTTAEWQAARRGLGEQEQRLHHELSTLPPPLLRVDPLTIRRSWQDMRLDERREVLRLFIERVTINRATPGTRGFDAGRVEVAWQYR